MGLKRRGGERREEVEERRGRRGVNGNGKAEEGGKRMGRREDVQEGLERKVKGRKG